MQEANRPLPLQGTKNTRELGGYLTAGGKKTKTHVFLRSDELNELTDSDREFLRDYGLTLDVDLRTLAERLADPDRINRRFVKYVEISLLADAIPDAAEDLFATAGTGIPRTMPQLYEFILETAKPQILRVLRDLIKAEDCALFHCTNGKDRTGLTAMLLLSAADVPEDTIIADYAVSQNYVRPQLKAAHQVDEEEFGAMLPEGAFDSKPEFMEKTIAFLKKTYGSAVGYLRAVGLTDEDLDALRAKFVEA